MFKFISFLLPLLLIGCHPSLEHTKEYRAYREIQKSHSLSKELGELKYLDKGKGEVIVLLHGVPSSGWLYRKMVDGLVNEGYRVIVPDMLGFGSSSSPAGYEIYSPKEHAQRLVSLMDKLKIKKWNHVFHDAGGTWTWEMMKNHEHRIKNLVILNSTNLAEGFFPPIKMKPGKAAKLAMWGYRNGLTTDILLKQLFKHGVTNPDQLTKADIAGYKLPLLENKTNGMYYFFSKTCNEFADYQKVIEKVKKPTTVIWGKYDTMLQWQPQSTKMISKLGIQKEDIHLIEAKHFIQEEKPELINQLIIQFLKK